MEGGVRVLRVRDGCAASGATRATADARAQGRVHTIKHRRFDTPRRMAHSAASAAAAAAAEGGGGGVAEGGSALDVVRATLPSSRSRVYNYDDDNKNNIYIYIYIYIYI